MYVPKDKVDYYKKVNELSFTEKQRRIGQPVKTQSTSESEVQKESGYIYYEVKYGDTLWEIAKKYPGVSQTDILRLNDLRNARNLQVGQTLKIKKET